MGLIPNFSNVSFACPPLGLSPKCRFGRRRRGSTSSRSMTERSRGLDFRTTGRASRRSCAALIRRCTSISRGRCASTRASRRPRIQRLLPGQSRRRAEGAFGRLRSRDASRLRFRSSARGRRRRHGGRRDRLDLRHADPLLRHPARLDERVDDDERRGAAGDGAATSSRPRSRACRWPSCRGPFRTTF